MQYALSLVAYSTDPDFGEENYHSFPKDLPTTTKLVDFFTNLDFIFVTVKITLIFPPDEKNTQCSKYYLDDFDLQLFAISNLNKPDIHLTHEFLPTYFWFGLLTTFQDLLDYIRVFFGKIVFHKQNQDNYLDYYLFFETRLKMHNVCLINHPRRCNLQEWLPYSISGKSYGCKITNLKIKEVQGNQILDIEDWRTYKPADESNFYCHFEFTLLCGDEQSATIVMHIASSHQVERKYFHVGIPSMFTLPKPTFIAVKYDLKHFFRYMGSFSEFFFGGSLNEILMKTKWLFEPLSDKQGDDLYAMQFSEFADKPIIFSDVHIGDIFTDAQPLQPYNQPRQINYQSSICYDDEDIFLHFINENFK